MTKESNKWETQVKHPQPYAKTKHHPVTEIEELDERRDRGYIVGRL